MKRRPKKPRARCLTSNFVYTPSSQMGDGYLAAKFKAIREQQAKASEEAEAKIAGTINRKVAA